MIEGDFARAYTPAEAERGKFVVLDTSTISGLPSTSYGKYAILTYQANPADLILSGGNVTVSSVQITNDVVIDHIITPVTVSAVQFPVSATIINSPIISAITEPITIASISNPVSISLSTTATLICSINLTANTSAVFSFNPVVTLVELYNNSSNKVYFQYTDTGVFADITTRGMIIDGESYYGMEKNIDCLTVATISGSDIRLFAHRR